MTDTGLTARLVRIKTSRIPGEIVSQIKGLIAQGKLKAGQKLPPERELAELFGVGRSSIREAIRQLELLGLVESRQGEGTFVTEATAETVSAPFVSLIAQSSRLYANVLEFRKVLEPRVAALAAQRATPENIAKMRDYVAKFEEQVGPPPGPVVLAMEYDTLFHYTLAEACQNVLVIRVLDATMGMLREFRQHVMESMFRSAAAATAHRMILEAIVARNSVAAQNAMEAHLEQLESAILPELS